MKNINFLIKPSSGLCDLRCQYCFYCDVASNREIESYGMMTLETAENLIKNAFETAKEQVGFAFQGGEPTLIGIDFYKAFIELVHLYNTGHIKVNYAMQTNGMTLDATWADFFYMHHFLLGLSMDGPKDIHDLARKDAKGKGTHQRVLKSAQLLTKHKVDFNILCVVNKNTAKHPEKVYRYFIKNNFFYLQYIPCLDPLEEAHGQRIDSLLPQDYGNFLCKTFDLWYNDLMIGQKISIRMFDNIVQMLLGYPPESCDMVGRCSVNMVIESDGSVYPCDFYVLDEWRLGNLNNQSISEIYQNPLGIDFVSCSLQEDEACKSCDYFFICRSGCRRHKESQLEGQLESNYFCSSYKQFYAYTLPRFKEVANLVRQGRIG